MEQKKSTNSSIKKLLKKSLEDLGLTSGVNCWAANLSLLLQMVGISPQWFFRGAIDDLGLVNTPDRDRRSYLADYTQLVIGDLSPYWTQFFVSSADDLVGKIKDHRGRMSIISLPLTSLKRKPAIDGIDSTHCIGLFHDQYDLVFFDPNGGPFEQHVIVEGFDGTNLTYPIRGHRLDDLGLAAHIVAETEDISRQIDAAMRSTKQNSGMIIQRKRELLWNATSRVPAPSTLQYNHFGYVNKHRRFILMNAVGTTLFPSLDAVDLCSKRIDCLIMRILLKDGWSQRNLDRLEDLLNQVCTAEFAFHEQFA